MVERAIAPRAPQGAVGRAELVRALRTGGEAGLEATASLIGYERRTPVTDNPPELERQAVSNTRFAQAAKALAPTPAPTAFRSIPFWRPTEAEHEDDTSELTPAHEREAVPELTEDFLRPPPDARAPDPPTLAPWPRLWRTLDDALRTPRPRREIDVATLVRRWARGESLRRLPRRAGLVHARVALVVDRGSHLIPFWDDQVWLVGELARRLGPASLRFLAPPTQESSPVVPIPENEVVLAISDLGALSGPGAGTAWLRYGRDLRRAGARLHALVPCPADRWYTPAADLWSAIDWGSPTGAPRRGAGPTEEDLAARCEDLLRLVSPAVRVEPGLLRQMRQLREVRDLVPGLDAGTEADVWSHSQVDGSSSVAMTLDPTSARQWRTELAELPEPVKKAVASTLLAWHHHLTRELQAEDVASLLACGLPEGWIGEQRVAETAEIFHRIGATLGSHEPDAGPMAAGVFAYFRRFRDRTSEGVWQHRRFREGLARAMVALRRHDAREKLPVGVTSEMLRMLAGPEHEDVRPWEVWHTGDVLEVRRPGQEGGGSLLTTIGSRGPRLTVSDGVRPTQEVDLGRPMARARLPVRGPGFSVRSDLEVVRVDALQKPGWAHTAGRDVFGLWAAFEVEGVEQRMRWMPPGRFLMGSPDDEPGRDDDEGPRHLVILTEGFWLADTPCTQDLWLKAMGENPSRFQSSGRPIERMSWNDAEEFLGRLNERVTGLEARLPTEAQWEYACRAGTDTGTWQGNFEILGHNNAPMLDDIAWYGGNSGVDFDLKEGEDSSGWPNKQYDHQLAGSREVALKGANPWGLYDMLGNVWEWCTDWYGSNYSASTVVDPTGPAEGTNRVRRGGSWSAHARDVRAASRNWFEPGIRYSNLGFRLSRGQESHEAKGRGAEGRGAEGRGAEGRSELGGGPAGEPRPQAGRNFGRNMECDCASSLSPSMEVRQAKTS